MITAQQLDDALRVQNVRLGKPNRHGVFCAVSTCRRALLPQEGKEVWVDGVKRGYACPSCQAVIARQVA